MPKSNYMATTRQLQGGDDMAKMKLTKRNIDKIKTPDKQADYRDTELSGFILRAFASNRKQFMLLYRIDGRRKAIKIGDYGALTPDAARTKAKELLADTVKGIDPQMEQAAAKALPTMGEWIATYLEDVRQRKKRPDSDERYLGWAKDRYGKKRIDKVTRADVQTHMQQLKTLGRTNATANRYHASVRSCLNEACRAGHIDYNVSANIRHYPEPVPRSRVLTDKEMKAMLAAIDALDDVFVQTSLHMLIETGARKSEVLSAAWKDIQFEDGLWRLPDTKSGKPQIIPLSASILARLRLLPHAGDWLYPSVSGEGHRQDIKRHWDKVRKAAGIPDVMLHDVRRTFGLHIARSAGLHVASKLLRHSSIKVTEEHYAPLGIDELRTSLEKHSAEVIQMVKHEA
jgi:integrase